MHLCQPNWQHVCPLALRKGVHPRPRARRKSLCCSADSSVTLESIGQLLTDKFKPIEQRVGGMEQELAAVRQRVDGIDKLIGTLLEHQASTQAIRMFGVDFARPLEGGYLQDLALLLPEEVVFSNRKEVYCAK